ATIEKSALGRFPTMDIASDFWTAASCGSMVRYRAHLEGQKSTDCVEKLRNRSARKIGKNAIRVRIGVRWPRAQAWGRAQGSIAFLCGPPRPLLIVPPTARNFSGQRRKWSFSTQSVGNRQSRGRAARFVARPWCSGLEKNSRAMSISKITARRFDDRPMRPAQTRKWTMRVMVLVKASEDSEKGVRKPEAFEAMGRFNEELVNAGIVLAADGLTPSSEGKRIAFDGPGRTVIDGPFAETRELVAGFWIWEVKDMDEAVAWVKRCPNPMSGPSEIEIRPLFDMASFAESLTPEFKEIRARAREKLSGKLGPAGAFGGLGT
ncbi:MAG: YciI family protein, partial [Caulobacteraceae bacterium]